MLSDFVLSTVGTPGVVSYPPGATFGPRQLRDWEFVWVIDGDAKYRWGDTSIAAPAGSIVLCRPGVIDSFQWDPNRSTRHGYFHFNLIRAPKWLGPINRWPLVRAPGEGDILRPIFRHILQLVDAPGERTQVTHLAIQHLLAAFITGLIETSDPLPEPLPPAVQRTMTYLYEQLDADPAGAIAFDDLAQAAHVTGPHLCRLFAKHLGRSPMQTARLARLDRAVDLLVRSNYSVKEIADLCGFANAFHFSRSFKQAFKMAPTQVRQRLAAGHTPPLPRLIRHRAVPLQPVP